MKILSVDIGTTAMKMGVFEERENDLNLLNQFNREYPINTYKEVSLEMPLADEILVSGGAVNEALIRAKTRWMRNCSYRFETESSLKGAAMLGQKYLMSN